MRRLVLATTLVVGLGLGLGRTNPASAEESAVSPTVSLATLVEAARKHHPTLAKQPLLADSLKLQNQQMNRAYWPQLSIGASATWQSEVTSVDIPIPGAMISPPPKDQYRATLNLQQNLWDGGVVADQKRVAAKRIRIEHEKVNLEWYQVHDRILQLYFAGVVQQEIQRQAELLDGYLDTTIKNAELALQNGIITERDVLLVKARQIEARQVIADARAQSRRVQRSLEDLSGASLPEASRFAGPVRSCEPTKEPHPSSDAVHRPELSLLAAQAELLAAQDKLDRAGDRPKLGAFATAGYGRPGLNMLSDSFDTYFIGGVQLTVPLSYLYTGKRHKAGQQLAIQRSLLARQQDAVMTQVHVQLDSQHAELARLSGAIKLDDELLQLREGARKQTELQLSLGTATMTDLVADLSEEDRARSQGAVHRAQRDLACHQLAFIKGDL
jgi:outer membrane protein TolC